MSGLTKFKPKFPVGHQRLIYNNDVTPNNYIKCDGSILSQSSYPALFDAIGLIADAAPGVYAYASVDTDSTPYAFLSAAEYGLSVGPAYVAGVATGGGVHVLKTSTNGINWTTRTGYTFSSNVIYGLTYNNNLYLYVGSNGNLAEGTIGTSTNAINWTEVSFPTATVSAITSITYGGGLYVYGGYPGKIGTSTDAINWTSRTSGTASNINALTYGNSLYVYGGNGGVLATSTNAINWTARTSGTTSTINAIVYANSLYVYATRGGGLSTSTNAINWTARTSGTVSAINALKYITSSSGATLYVYGGAGGVLATSTNAINWTAQTSGTASVINAIGYGNSTYNTDISAANIILIGAVDTIRAGRPYTYDYTTQFALPTTTGAFTVNSSYPYSTYIKGS